MIIPPVPSQFRKTSARLPALLPEPESRLRPPVAYSDGTAVPVLSEGEALVVDVRAGMTPAEQVQRKLMALLGNTSPKLR